MKKLIIILLLISCIESNARDTFSKVQIKLDSIYTFAKIAEMGIDLESAIIKEGVYINTIVNQYELNKLIKLNLIDTIEIADVEKYNLDNAIQYNPDKDKSNSKSDLEYFKLGSLGGYYILEEIYANFDLMMNLFPAIVSKEKIGSSILGKDIIAFKLHLDNNEITNPDEVLYTALHHAREPQGVTTVIYFIWHLLENYKNNSPESTYLLKSKVIYVIPVINPDSYKLNQQTPTVGGGLIRKNQRIINDSTKGVDLNRNYGPYEFWNSAAGGSDNNPSSEVYRGKTPFSEPETDAIQQFTLKHKFKTAINYHSYGNLFIHPGTAVEGPIKDSLIMQQIGFYVNETNKYVYGPDIRSVGYYARGTSDDWFYTERVSGKASTLSFTPELGHSYYGFWGLVPDMILDVAKENLKSNYAALYYAKDFIVKSDVLIPNEKSILINLRNIGLVNSSKTQVTLKSINNSVTINNANREVQISSTKNQPLLFNFEFTNSTVKNGDKVGFELSINQFGFDKKDTIYKVIGYGFTDTIFSSSEIKSYWDSQLWGREKDYLTGKSILTDSPNAVYKDGNNNYVSFIDNLSLSNLENATLEYDTRFNIERDFDIGTVELSIDSSKTWIYLNADRMIKGMNMPNSKQRTGMFGYHGHINEWFHQSIDLTSYLGKKINIRFGMISDGAGHYEGFFLDNIIIRKYKSGFLSEVNESNKINNEIQIVNDNHFIKLLSQPNGKFNYLMTDILGNSIKYGELINNSINIDDVGSGVYNFVIYNQTQIQNYKIAITR